ncbi:hypothetical protein SBA6_40103 [Candidatus Sulfopaludibacter sp. SbA6]|nr:hypothetical protein SBA6_40103 [Candidatus Sulfopaludibacter sp. SbA6]
MSGWWERTIRCPSNSADSRRASSRRTWRRGNGSVAITPPRRVLFDQKLDELIAEAARCVSRSLYVRRVVFFVVLLAPSGWAQTFRGSLTSTVTDTSGAALPEAAVRLDNPATGFTRTTIATSTGEYNFPDLAAILFT